MNKMRKKERRKNLRLKVYHLIKYNALTGEKVQAIPILASLKDIGAGGVCLRTENNLPVSSTLQLKINFPSQRDPISCLAKVIWIKQRGKSRYYEIGARFTEIDESTRKIIDERVSGVIKMLGKKRFKLI